MRIMTHPAETVSFGSFIRELRKERGYTQLRLAQEANWYRNGNFISAVEHNIKVPGSKRMPKLQDVLGFTFDEGYGRSPLKRLSEKFAKPIADKNSFGAILRELRLEEHLFQREVTERMIQQFPAVSERTISNYEHNRHYPSKNILETLGEIVGFTLDQTQESPQEQVVFKAPRKKRSPAIDNVPQRKAVDSASFGGFISMLREERGYTQTELGQLMGVAISHFAKSLISQIERNKLFPGEKRMEKLKRILAFTFENNERAELSKGGRTATPTEPGSLGESLRTLRVENGYTIGDVAQILSHICRTPTQSIKSRISKFEHNRAPLSSWMLHQLQDILGFTIEE